MDKSDMLLQKYGLEPYLEYRDEIRELLEHEIINDLEEDNEYLKTLCILLFVLGNAEDTLLIWRAKNKNFDTGSYIDGELLLGAGTKNTVKYLMTLKTSDSKAELKYIKHNVNDFNKQELITFYKSYYGLQL